MPSTHRPSKLEARPKRWSFWWYQVELESRKSRGGYASASLPIFVEPTLIVDDLALYE